MLRRKRRVFGSLKTDQHVFTLNVKLGEIFMSEIACLSLVGKLIGKVND
jgi:hypothetical protein